MRFLSLATFTCALLFAAGPEYDRALDLYKHTDYEGSLKLLLPLRERSRRWSNPKPCCRLPLPVRAAPWRATLPLRRAIALRIAIVPCSSADLLLPKGRHPTPLS